MDSLGSLNAFVKAAEARNFTVAGRQLGVSSSAVARRWRGWRNGSACASSIAARAASH